MKVSGYFARQFAQPSGLVGRYLIAPWLDRSNRQATDSVFGALELDPDWRVAEIGFGGGELLRRISASLQSGTVVGVDPSRDVIERMQARIKGLPATDRVELCLGTADHLPLPDSDLDLVISVNTIYFWESISESLSELHRVLKSGGRLVLGFSEGKSLESAGYLEFGYRVLSQGEVMDRMQSAGFASITHNDVDRGTRGKYHVVTCHRL